MKKCPPEVICLKNITLFFMVLILGIFIYYNSKTTNIQSTFYSTLMPTYPYNNIKNDILMDPYSPPYRDERYIVPINVQTNIGATPVSTEYRQIGIITLLNGTSKDNILQLMGRPLFTNRDKWQYYTISNQHNNVKLPISFKGKSALNDYGVDKIYNGDTVYVEGYNDAFKVTLYENDTIRYLPFV